MNRHSARSQFSEPMLSMPEEILSARLLQRERGGKHGVDASLSFSSQRCDTNRKLGALKDSLPELDDRRGAVCVERLVD